MNSLNSAFEDQLYYQYLSDPDSVSQEWREYFQARSKSGRQEQISQAETQAANASPAVTTSSAPKKQVATTSKVQEDDTTPLASYQELEQLSSISTKIAANMEESLRVPTATSVRTIPVKALDENRRIINKYLLKQRRPKVSFSQILLWAILKSIIKYPNMQSSYSVRDGKSYKIKNNAVNVGLAVDVERKDGSRLLLVPSLKDSDKMNFSDFIRGLDEIIKKARKNKLTVDDLVGATVTLTNPGMIGTTASIPRLMKGQGLIIATGAIEYPAEFQAVRPEVINTFAVSKVFTMTSTYDHRVIQGAESAQFLAYIHELLIGKHRFYDQIFAALNIPFEPVLWEVDTSKSKYTLNSSEEHIEKAVHVMRLLHSYRVRGHLLAHTNPLGMESYYYPEMNPSHYNLSIWDLDRSFPAVDTWPEPNMILRDLLELLRDTYCGSIGYEFMHLTDSIKRDWIKNELEAGRQYKPTVEDKNHILSLLIDAEQFEQFLHTKFIGHKRFSLEGSESLIVLLDSLFHESNRGSVSQVVLGMAHRGRLNVLVNNVGKKLSDVFDEFEGNYNLADTNGSGDVKYHLGDDGEYEFKNGGTIKVKLAPNPSHLEIINPVVLGMARAIQDQQYPDEPKRVMPVLIHGDAAIAGQGVVQEILNMGNLSGYSTKGTIHIVINNQIGFTTSTEDARSTPYATDIARMLQVPILHVNGNDPEAVAQAGIFAAKYRETFESDVIIDLLSYRKYGHNEGDEPSYTQPLLYNKIRSMDPVRKMYQDELIESGTITPEEADQHMKENSDKLNTAFDNRGKKEKKEFSPERVQKRAIKPYPTQGKKENLDKIINGITTWPENFNINPKVKGGLSKRRKMFDADEPMMDWALAEALAFGDILLDGKPIRLSGEDSRRGTFSQRHGVLIDFVNERNYIPLNNIENGQNEIEIFDSPLSELGVMGFDYGYSVIDRTGLTLWEAQFGDFANMAQPIIDQFIACGEVKWGQTSNLVLLLPHGNEGQGPEHSSARLERFLQLCAEYNMIVANFTTPAQYYHALKRQVIIEEHVPLVIMTPKSMLRHPLAVSSVSDLTDGELKLMIDDESVSDKSAIKRVLLCSGKVYYDLLDKRNKDNKTDVAIVRIEQLYPLDKEQLENIIHSYSNATEIVWVQEEHRNQGAWHYLAPFMFMRLKEGQNLHYVGRYPSASSATGSSKIFTEQQKRLVDEAINGELKELY
ncbi:MAG: multifunctional oxoglutarate decarboxylase/oxoglutarate dehydrogenase thiamine pyrophosphate-binding subunit/dihydrolipoyllysine-residue succinyltransferase subunit [Candidatus Kapaibacteriales bacterium]